MKALRFITTILLLVSIRAAADRSGEKSIVQVITTYQDYDPFLPWQKKTPRTRFGYGVVIGKSRIITTESLVRNYTLVQLKKAESGERISASVQMMDPQANLAILKIEDADKARGLEPIRLAKHVRADAKVEILQFDETTEIQRGEGKVLQILMNRLPSAAYSSLTYKLSTSLSVNGEGNPVIYKNRLAGLVMTHEQGNRVSEMVPCSIIKHFLDDLRELPYNGFASAGFRWKTLVDPAKRQYLNVPDDSQGILIVSCLPKSGAAKTLKPNDVILEWDGHAINNMGYYDDPDFGRLIFSHLIKGRSEPGNIVPVKVIRNHKRTTVNVELSNWSNAFSLIPENDKGDQAEYLVEGGLVIRELSGDYLRAYGSRWDKMLDSRLVYSYMTLKHTSDKEDEHIIILSRALPHSINISYEPFINDVITHLNGQSVKSMDDVFRIADKDKHITRISIQSCGVDLVLDKKDLVEANKAIKKLYRLPSLRYQRKTK